MSILHNPQWQVIDARVKHHRGLPDAGLLCQCPGYPGDAGRRGIGELWMAKTLSGKAPR